MGITPVVLRNLANAPATPAYPAATYVLHAQDMNAIRRAISTGQEAIYTLGIKLGTGGIEVQTTTPLLMDSGATLQVLDGWNESVVVGALTNDGERSMQRFVVIQELILQADALVRIQGSPYIYLAEQEQTNVQILRGGADVLDL